MVAEDVAGYGPADSILDIGTGPGRRLLALRRVSPGASLTGVDISAAMATQARRNIDRGGRPEGIVIQVAGAGPRRQLALRRIGRGVAPAVIDCTAAVGVEGPRSGDQ